MTPRPAPASCGYTRQGVATRRPNPRRVRTTTRPCSQARYNRPPLWAAQSSSYLCAQQPRDCRRHHDRHRHRRRRRCGRGRGHGRRRHRRKQQAARARQQVAQPRRGCAPRPKAHRGACRSLAHRGPRHPARGLGSRARHARRAQRPVEEGAPHAAEAEAAETGRAAARCRTVCTAGRPPTRPRGGRCKASRPSQHHAWAAWWAARRRAVAQRRAAAQRQRAAQQRRAARRRPARRRGSWPRLGSSAGYRLASGGALADSPARAMAAHTARAAASGARRAG